MLDKAYQLRSDQLLPLINSIEGSFSFIYSGQTEHSDSRTFRIAVGPIDQKGLKSLLLGYHPIDQISLLAWNADQNIWDLVSKFSGAIEIEIESILAGQVLCLPSNSAVHRGGLVGLIDVVEQLLEPVTGCPWDLEQTPSSLMKYLIEESYELGEAIESGDQDLILEELGDVLLQPIMQAEMSKRTGQFNLHDIGQKIADKLVHRHPHVFEKSTELSSAEVLKQWDIIKKQEKGSDTTSLLDGIPKSMPALLRGLNISKRAARAGFEWPDFESVVEKLHEEIKELDEAILGKNREEQISELGDVLFTIVNVARWLKIDPEEALRLMLIRFTARFNLMEQKSSKPLTELSPLEWDMLWNEAKTNLQKA